MYYFSRFLVVLLIANEEGKMKSRMISMAVIMILVSSTLAHAQFKSQVQEEPRVSDGMIHDSSPTLFLGWFNPERFHMNHSFNLSYQTIGGQGLSLGTYTNSMRYDFADNLNARADVSLSYSPNNSFSTYGKKNDFSSVYLSRAQLNYKPWDNVVVQVQYSQLPYTSPYYSPFYSPWYRENGY
jgi:hypothetical protein